MPSSTDAAYSLTTSNASSTPYTLQIMTVVAVIFTPLVLLYQGWTYWVFRRRVTVEPLPADEEAGRADLAAAGPLRRLVPRDPAGSPPARADPGGGGLPRPHASSSG